MTSENVTEAGISEAAEPQPAKVVDDPVDRRAGLPGPG